MAMALLAAPRVKRRTVVTIAFLLFLTCLACYLLAPYCKTLANWLPFASSLGDTPHASHQPAPAQTISLVAGTGAPSSASSSSSATAPTPTPTPTPAPTGTVTPAPTSPSVVVTAKPKAVPTSSAPPVVKSTSEAAVVPVAPPPAVQQTTESFTPHAITSSPPADFSKANQNAAYMARADACAQTGTDANCTGLRWGTSQSCQYPPYSPYNFGPAIAYSRAGWAMWQIAPNECRYAMVAS
jgi:hypothetical protein